jgi:hypothetical protein
MNKKVKLILIPSNTSTGIWKGLVKHNDKVFYLSLGCIAKGDKPQQLLIVSDDEIQINDMYYTTGSKTLEYSVFRCDTERLVKISNELNAKKIIASYPHILGTLPISKETIQEWINAGTPEEGNIEIIDDNNFHLKEDWSYVNKEITSFLGNLILKFDKEEEEEHNDEDIYDAIMDFRKNHPEKTIVVESSIPTDAEIEKKAKLLSWKNCRSMVFPEDNWKDGFVFGYKQALKDLGHE